MAGIFKTFWGSLVMLIAILVVLDRAGGLSKILAASGTFVNRVVTSFR